MAWHKYFNARNFENFGSTSQRVLKFDINKCELYMYQ